MCVLRIFTLYYISTQLLFVLVLIFISKSSLNFNTIPRCFCKPDKHIRALFRLGLCKEGQYILLTCLNKWPMRDHTGRINLAELYYYDGEDMKLIGEWILRSWAVSVLWHDAHENEI